MRCTVPFCANCGVEVSGASQSCGKCGKPLGPAAVPVANKSDVGRKLKIALIVVFIFLVFKGISGSKTERSDTSSNITDDAELVISKCGNPDVDDSNINDNPRPLLPMRLLEYKAQNIRFSFIPRGDTASASSPPYQWKMLGVQDTETNQSLDVNIARQRMPCWVSH